MKNITPGYYWARTEYNEITIVKVYETHNRILWVDVIGTSQTYTPDNFYFIQKIETPEFVVDKLEEQGNKNETI